VGGLWLEDQVPDALQEGVTPVGGELVDRPLGSSTVPCHLQRFDHALPLQLVEGVVQRSEVELDVPVHVLLPHPERDLVGVQRSVSKQAQHRHSKSPKFSHFKYSERNIPERKMAGRGTWRSGRRLCCSMP